MRPHDLSFRRIVVGALLLAALGGSNCGRTPYVPPSDSPARIYLNLAFKRSCGFEPADYDASCLGAISLTARNAVETQNVCGVIAPPDDLDAFVNSGFAELALGTLSDRGETVFELRGLHTRDLMPGDDVCGNPDDKGRWLLWGESPPVDLAALREPDAPDQTVIIPVDCRDCAGGCEDFGEETCPVDPTSFCVPVSPTLSCNKVCDGESECFEGQLTCAAGAAGEPSMCALKDNVTGQLCSPCSADTDCDLEEGYNCVARLGEDTGICAPRCPDNRFDNRCPRATICTRVGNDLWPVDQMPGSNAPDAGLHDAGLLIDSGPSDSGLADSGVPSDGGPSDSGVSESGPADSGASDSGASDSGASGPG